MPHKPWEDLIPFYVAQTLPLPDAAALERHLAHCPDCRQSVDEWRAIAAAVRVEASRQASWLPPLSPRVSAAPQAISANGAGQHDAYVLPTYPRRQARLSLTLAAALLTVLLFGGLLALMASRLPSQQDVSDATSVAAAPGVTLTPRRGATVMPTPTAILISSPTPTAFNTSQDLGILPSRTPTATPFVVYLTPTTMPLVVYLTPTRLPSTAVQPTNSSGGGGMAQPQFAPPSSTPLPWPACTASPIGVEDVRVFAGPGTDQPFTGILRAGEVAQVTAYASGWYVVILPDGNFGWVPGAAVKLDGVCDTLLSPSATPIYPPATPTAMFGSATGYSLITTQTVGNIPANTRVRLSHMWYNGETWIYVIVAEDEVRTGEARQTQLAFAPDYTPGPTPMMQFGSSIGMGYLMITTTAVGDIPANTRVRISHASYDGQGWLYFIVAEDEVRTGQARENQITYAPNVTPGPTPTPRFTGYIGGAYAVMTLETVGPIPANTYVRIGSARFNGTTWIYTIATDSGVTADAQQDQLTFSPYTAPNPTPTAVYNSAIGSGRQMITTQAVGGIPANTTVTITYAWYDGSAWWYGIMAGNGQTAEAREGQIVYRPNATPTSTPIP